MRANPVLLPWHAAAFLLQMLLLRVCWSVLDAEYIWMMGTRVWVRAVDVVRNTRFNTCRTWFQVHGGVNKLLLTGVQLSLPVRCSISASGISFETWYLYCIYKPTKRATALYASIYRNCNQAALLKSTEGSLYFTHRQQIISREGRQPSCLA